MSPAAVRHTLGALVQGDGRMSSMKVPSDLQKSWPRQSSANQVFIFRHQPLRLLYQLYFIATFPLRLCLVILPQTLHQRFFDASAPPNYRYIDIVGITIARTLIDKFWLPTGGGERGTHYVAPLSKAQQLKTLKKTSALTEVIHPKVQVSQLRQPVQSWAEQAGVDKADDLTIWWLGKRSEHVEQSKAKKDEKIMLYLSGGGYLIGTAYPGHDFGSIAPTILKHIKKECKQNSDALETLPQSIVSVEYRRTELAPLPGALIDALSIYRHLVDDLYFKPSNISLSGDSAGGHLVNFLVRYLVEGGEEIPGKIVLISPWGDQAGTTIEHRTSSFQQMLPYDILSDHFYHYCKDVFARKLHNANSEALLDVYFSPTALLGMVHTRDASQSNKLLITKQTEKDIFKGWPSTLVLCGDYEVLKDQSVDMVKRLRLAKEAEGKLQEKEISFFTIKTNHDPFVAPPFVFSKERKDAMQRIVAWLAL